MLFTFMPELVQVSGDLATRHTIVLVHLWQLVMKETLQRISDTCFSDKSFAFKSFGISLSSVTETHPLNLNPNVLTVWPPARRVG